MLVRLADWCYRARRLVVVLWIAALVGAFALAGAFGGEFRQDYLQPGSESKAASDTLQDRFPQRAGRHRRRSWSTRTPASPHPQVRARAERVFADVADSDHVVSVVSPFTEGGAEPDLRRRQDRVRRRGTRQERQRVHGRARPRHWSNRSSRPATTTLQVEVGGPVAALSQTAPVGSEGIGLIAAAIILLVTFGSAVAMGLPLLTALFGLGIAMALGEVLRRVVDVPDWAPATAAMVGIGVGIDYALLIVTRFRSSLAEGQEPRRRDADRDRDRRASRAVRRPHRGRLDARHPADGPAGHDRLRLHRGARRPGHHGRVGDAAAGRARLRRPQHRAPARAVGEQGRPLATTRPAGTAGAASSSAGRGSPRSAASPSSLRWPPRSSASASVSPTPQNDPPGSTTRQAYDLLADGFGPGFSAPMLLTVQGQSDGELRDSADAVGDTAARGPRRGVRRSRHPEPSG